MNGYPRGNRLVQQPFCAGAWAPSGCAAGVCAQLFLSGEAGGELFFRQECREIHDGEDLLERDVRFLYVLDDEVGLLVGLVFLVALRVLELVFDGVVAA